MSKKSIAELHEDNEYIDTGSDALEKLCSGGVPVGRVILFGCSSSTGKSFCIGKDDQQIKDMSIK